jgi:hypothetical protein
MTRIPTLGGKKLRAFLFIALFAFTAMKGQPCKITPSSGGGEPESPSGCPEQWAGVEHVCGEGAELRCVPFQYWLEDTACAKDIYDAELVPTLLEKTDTYEKRWCVQSGTNLKFALACVELNAACGSLISSPAFFPQTKTVAWGEQ